MILKSDENHNSVVISCWEYYLENAEEAMAKCVPGKNSVVEAI